MIQIKTSEDSNHTIMALPLQIFMKDLLDQAPHSPNHAACELVVDNARTPNNSTPERELMRLLRHQRRRWEIKNREDAKRQQQRSKSKGILDISDHSKKDSRWESIMSGDGQSSSPISPARPLQAHPTSLSPAFEAWDLRTEKDTTPRAYRHGRPPASEQTRDQQFSLRSNANTIKSVEEAIAICSISA